MLQRLEHKQLETHNKARLRDQYTLTGSFWVDIAIGSLMGPLWYGILVAFYSF